MKPFKILSLLCVLIAGAWITPQEASAQYVSASFRLFYDELSPYGTWVDYQNYGYVWMPDAEVDFMPYGTDGHWVFTHDGWTWFSDYPWGWATFHYGRWDYDDEYGWFWVPDNEWGPAWVSWRRSPGYFGWAPLRPGISINIAFGRNYRERNERWLFVRDRDIGRSDISHQYIPRSQNTTIINRSTLIVNVRRDAGRNATYVTGPSRNDVQRVTRSTVNPVVIRETNKPGHRLTNGELQLYRPRVQKAENNGQRTAPSKVANLRDLRPVAERNAARRQQQSPGEDRTRSNQPPSVIPSTRGQSPQPMNVDRSRDKREDKQPQKMMPPTRNKEPRPENKPDEKSKKREH